MIRYRTIGTLTLALTLAGLSAGCGKPPEPPPPTPAGEAAEPTSEVDRDAADRAAREAEAARLRALEEEARRTRAALEEMVFFDYDRSEVRADARRVLEAKRPILRDTPAVRMRIEGHADERGSTEYNIALGMRRAQSVKQYLVDFGLDASRFEITSYGEERPLAAGTGETAWSRNRRAEFVITGGLPVLAPEPR